MSIYQTAISCVVGGAFPQIYRILSRKIVPVLLERVRMAPLSKITFYKKGMSGRGPVYTGTHRGARCKSRKTHVTRGKQDEVRCCPCSRGGSPDVGSLAHSSPIT